MSRNGEGKWCGNASGGRPVLVSAYFSFSCLSPFRVHYPSLGLLFLCFPFQNVGSNYWRLERASFFEDLLFRFPFLA